MLTDQKLILLELNEINFEYVKRYAVQGRLPGFKKLLEKSPLIETSSEREIYEFEPWIQWMSIHTGKTLSQHHVFRLGDVVDYNEMQIWEYLERTYGLKVGAVSPMNADNRCAAAAFFLPDPWTGARVSGNWFLRRISAAVANAVNQNATGRVKLSSYLFLLAGMLRYSFPRRRWALFDQIFKSLRTSYQRAILLDNFLTDIFCTLWQDSRPDFATLFLNGCAHLQHHYLFNSPHYDGPHKNPDWYMQKGRDPVLNGFRAYDKILQDVMDLPGAPRVIIATGLHQTPVEQPVYYWRLKDHSDFLNRIGIDHIGVRARMSRDFLVLCQDEDQAAKAELILKQCMDKKGESIFGDIDNRGTSVFASLVYPHDIRENFVLQAGKRKISDFETCVGFVALKNAEHNGQGYIIDSANKIPAGKSLPVTEIFALVEDHFEKTKAALPSETKAA